jgi:hypothetical protein
MKPWEPQLPSGGTLFQVLGQKSPSAITVSYPRLLGSPGCQFRIVHRFPRDPFPVTAPWRVFVAPNVHLGVDTATAQQSLVQVPNEGFLLSGSDGCKVSASAPIDSLLGGSFSSTPRDSRSHNNLVVVPVIRPLYRLGSCWLHENKYAQKGDHPYNMKGNIPHTSDPLSLQAVD